MAKDYLIDEATGKPYIQGKLGKYRIDLRTGKKFVIRATREQDDKVFQHYQDEGAKGKSKPKVNKDGFYREGWITQTRKIIGGKLGSWPEKTPFELGEKGKYRINPDTGKRFFRGDTREEDTSIFIRYRDSIPPREADGFIREQWRSLEHHARRKKGKPDDGKRDFNALRINPHTNIPFQSGDTRPTIPTKDGKTYPQDGYIYSSTSWRIDNDGFYSDHWLAGVEKNCVSCGVLFLSVPNRTRCKTCAPPTTNIVLREIWEEAGEKPCLSSIQIKSRTGCDNKPKKLTEENFPKGSRGGWRLYCHDCLDEIQWSKNIFRNYNVTADQYYKQLDAQDNGCSICKIPKNNSSTTERLFVDHDHISGINRGIICHKCNQMIGKQGGRDDPEVLYNGFLYLTYSLLTNIQQQGDKVSGFAKAKPIKNASDLFDDLQADILKTEMPDEIKLELLRVIKRAKED